VLFTQLKDAVIHGTASDTEFTILETLKLILMELLKVSDDYEEVVKERVAAAAERAAASEERRAAAAERQAVKTLLDRLWPLLTKTAVSDSFSDQGRDQVQQTGHDDTVLVASELEKQQRCQDGTCIQESHVFRQRPPHTGTTVRHEHNVEDFVANVNDACSGNNIVEVVHSQTADSTAYTHSEIEDKSCCDDKISLNGNLENMCKDASLSRVLIENRTAMQLPSTLISQGAKQSHKPPESPNLWNHLLHNSIMPKEEKTMVDFQFKAQDQSLTSPSSWASWIPNQASSKKKLRTPILKCC
jgi:hypothetical protein